MAAGPPNDTGLSDGGQNVGRLIRAWCALAVAALAAACATVPDAPAGPSLDAIEASLARDIATLSDDSFAGRYPGTPGEAKTRAWLIDRFVELGLQPGAGGQQAQPWGQRRRRWRETATPSTRRRLNYY